MLAEPLLKRYEIETFQQVLLNLIQRLFVLSKPLLAAAAQNKPLEGKLDFQVSDYRDWFLCIFCRRGPGV